MVSLNKLKKVHVHICHKFKYLFNPMTTRGQNTRVVHYQRNGFKSENEKMKNE